MKTEVLCLCTILLSLAVASSAVPQERPTSLPFLGSRENIERSWDENVYRVTVILKRKDVPDVEFTKSAPHERGSGTLVTTLKSLFTELFTEVVTSADAGKEFYATIGFRWEVPLPVGTRRLGIECGKPSFTVELDENGVPIPPTDSVISWQYNNFLIAPMPQGVKYIRHLRWDANGNLADDIWTTNGSDSLWQDEPYALVVRVYQIDADRMRFYGQTGFMRLYYDETKTLYDEYDVLTGQLSGSSIVSVEMQTLPGEKSPLPQIESENASLPTAYAIIHGFPGTRVVPETSPSLLHRWIDYGPMLTIGSDGTVSTPLPDQNPLFVRVRVEP